RGVTGVLLANELLDALPPHVVVMRRDGLREIFVGVEDDRFVEIEREPSTPEIEAYFARAGVRLEPGWRAEVNLAAVAWVREAARALARGFLLLVDYGHEAAVLYSPSHASGTLTAYSRHVASVDPLAWLEAPGTRDLTAHVDLTAVRRAAEEEGLETIGIVDQMYFFLALGLADRLDASSSLEAVRRRLAARALVQPGGLGSTHKVMVFARGVGRPALRGFAGGGRLT
ncbi:MAG TPA: class I SAM-dependent methyltransferase, partial [Vicinamibacterales bacterium]|nr:class I SAM-dependent methyltransferase [Vicinamibacterales bacterium]